MDFRYGSGRIRERAVQLLHHEATTLLRGSYSDSTGRALLTAVAQAARLAASMAAYVGRPALAQRYYIQGYYIQALGCSTQLLRISPRGGQQPGWPAGGVT